jgi:quercetin dioxygenase-like cupin family protein
MKAIKTISVLLFMGCLFISPNVQAQDPMSIGKVYKKVLLDNDKVRVMSVIFEPGDAMPWHNHPAHTVYVVTGGTIEITPKDGKPATMELKAGDVVYMEPVTHMGKNVGKTTIKLVVTELKH